VDSRQFSKRVDTASIIITFRRRFRRLAVKFGQSLNVNEVSTTTTSRYAVFDSEPSIRRGRT